MKKIFFLSAFALLATIVVASQPNLVLSVSSAANFAQDTGKITPVLDINTLTPNNMIQQVVDPVYSVLVLLLGLLSGFIPGLKRIEKKSVRVLAIGISIALGFMLFGGGSFWKYVVSYVISNFAYIVSVKPLFRKKTDDKSNPILS